MYKNHDKPILEFVLLMIDEAQKVVEKYGSAYYALNNFESKNSILLNLIQIGEKLHKIKSKNIIDVLPIIESYSIRNRITHDYQGLNLVIVEGIVEDELPELRGTILQILKDDNEDK